MKLIYTLLFALLLNTGFAQAGTWKLAPVEASLAVGPAIGDFSWWFITAADVETRACLYDDEFVFNADGTFQNVQGDATWIEAWQGMDPEGCGAPVAPHDGSNDATWSFDADASTMTLTGVGAHLGLPKVINGAEISDPSTAPESITYPVVLSEDGNTMTVDISFGDGIWHYVLAKQAGTTSVSDQNADFFSVYPNPAVSEVVVSSEVAVDRITLRDITGKIVVIQDNAGTNATVNVSDLAQGLYLLECRAGKSVAVRKVVVQ